MKADVIDKPEYFPRSGVHGGNWFRAKGDVEIKVKKSLPGKDKNARPETGAVLEGEDTEVIVTGRFVKKDRNKVDGKEVGSASGGVRIFGRLRRSRR